MATDLTAKARTWVKSESTRAPLEESRGWPERIKARSVVVPPISTTTLVWPASVRARTPMMLAAGPEKMVSTGMPTDLSRGRVPPSALRM
ncbi:MAG: hypothetical protein BWY79_02072 [Actinobacteria bacterium ADurb.Bin444]|nr:MAG: hypothetical protein BWY79_02072 [Actinobacteria bacterium ADurb.Bin444]